MAREERTEQELEDRLDFERHQQHEWEKNCIAAMAGIEDPAAFVANEKTIREWYDGWAQTDESLRLDARSQSYEDELTALRASHAKLVDAMEGLLSDANPNADDLEMLCQEACTESEYAEEAASSIESLRRTQLAGREALASLPPA